VKGVISVANAGRELLPSERCHFGGLCRAGAAAQ